jgi:hypothetical protein
LGKVVDDITAPLNILSEASFDGDSGALSALSKSL